MAHLVNLVVNRGVLLNVSIGRGNVGFGLIVIVVADEVANVIIWEKTFELGGELRGKRFVVRNDKRRQLNLFYDFGYRESFARARCAQKHLRF